MKRGSSMAVVTHGLGLGDELGHRHAKNALVVAHGRPHSQTGSV